MSQICVGLFRKQRPKARPRGDEPRPGASRSGDGGYAPDAGRGANEGPATVFQRARGNGRAVARRSRAQGCGPSPVRLPITGRSRRGASGRVPVIRQAASSLGKSPTRSASRRHGDRGDRRFRGSVCQARAAMPRSTSRASASGTGGVSGPVRGAKAGWAKGEASMRPGPPAGVRGVTCSPDQSVDSGDGAKRNPCFGFEGA